MSLALRRILAGALLLVGCLGLGCGLLAGVLMPWLFDADTARVRRLQPISYVAFEDGAPGREALIEGRLSERNRAGAEGFVVYTRYVAQVEADGDRVWRSVETARPPLLVELPGGGLVRVRGDYTLSGSLESEERGPLRVEGLRAGAALIAVGELVEGQESVELQADLIAAGARDDYLRSSRGASAFFAIFGRSLLAVSALMLAGGILLLLRLLRRRGPTP